MAKSYIIGIDEVGRGSLAGPVIVVAVLLPKKLKVKNKTLGHLKDSKKLTVTQREKWFRFFKGHPKVKYTLAKIYPRKIERINISAAANLAAFRAHSRLISSNRLSNRSFQTYLDGGLFLGNGQSRIPAKTVVRGDEKISAIKIASILAKVTRDRLMTRLAKRYPRYGFETHKGYGTRAHLVSLRRFGPSIVHRLTFVSKYLSIKPPSI